MREISLYKMEPVYVAGETDNLIALQCKLEADNGILAQIESDYNRNQVDFKCEYIKAKKHHLSNLRFYYWLILKKYFDDALVAEIPSFPDYQKEQMKKQGWMFPQFFINSRITTTGNVGVTTEELYIRNFDRMFDNLFGFSIGEPNSRIDRYYKQAILNYKNQCYYSCAVSLFPIIESYHQYITNFNEDSFYKIKENLDSVKEKMENVNQVFNIRIEYYINLVNNSTSWQTTTILAFRLIEKQSPRLSIEIELCTDSLQEKSTKRIVFNSFVCFQIWLRSKQYLMQTK